MPEITFVDDNMRLAKYHLLRDYSELSKQVWEQKEYMTHYVEEQGRLVGYTIIRNEALSKLYEGDFFVVRFSLADFRTEHRDDQKSMLVDLMQYLWCEMKRQKGCYIFRLPSHFVDIMQAYNQVFRSVGGCFCGGTVEEIIHGKMLPYKLAEGMNIFSANRNYLEKHFNILLELTFDSFKEYHGQYHISPYTESLAGKIYENWIRDSLQNTKDRIVVAELFGKPIGFITLSENENAVEGVLNAVAKEYRNLGAYRAMLCFVINEATKKEKSFVISTQQDNFIVQGIWNSIGLRPFYSIYNIHIQCE